METLQELAKEIIKKYDESGVIEHDTKHFSVRGMVEFVDHQETGTEHNGFYEKLTVTDSVDWYIDEVLCFTDDGDEIESPYTPEMLMAYLRENG